MSKQSTRDRDTDRHVLIAGCGYVGMRLAERLAAEGQRVSALRRTQATMPEGVEGFQVDFRDPSTFGRLPDVPTALVYAASADEGTEQAYRRAYVDGPRALLEHYHRSCSRSGQRAIDRVVFVSSTAVYGERAGAWVDECTAVASEGFRAKLLGEGEAQVQRAAEQGWVGRSVILRLGGIYGPGRTRLLRQVLDGSFADAAKRSFGNRIHRDDCAGAIAHLLALPEPEAVYIGVDRDQAPLDAVYRWLAERRGLPTGAIPQSPRDRGKRCSSRRLQRSGYEFLFPSFREGYASLDP